MKSAALVLSLLLIPAAAQATVLNLLPLTTVTRLDQDTWRFDMQVAYTGWDYLYPASDGTIGYIPTIESLQFTGGFGVPFDINIQLYPDLLFPDENSLGAVISGWRGNGFSTVAFSFVPGAEALSGNQYWFLDTYGTTWGYQIWNGPDSYWTVDDLSGSATVYGALPTTIGDSTTWMVTPEPPPLWTLAAGLGLLGIGGLTRRRRRTSSRPTEPR